jgi:hypothetical protein
MVFGCGLSVAETRQRVDDGLDARQTRAARYAVAAVTDRPVAPPRIERSFAFETKDPS